MLFRCMHTVLFIMVSIFFHTGDSFSFHIPACANRFSLNKLSDASQKSSSLSQFCGSSFIRQSMKPKNLLTLSEKKFDISRLSNFPGSKTLVRKRFILAIVILSFLVTFRSVMFRPLSYGIGTLMAPVSWASNMVSTFSPVRCAFRCLMRCHSAAARSRHHGSC